MTSFGWLFQRGDCQSFPFRANSFREQPARTRDERLVEGEGSLVMEGMKGRSDEDSMRMSHCRLSLEILGSIPWAFPSWQIYGYAERVASLFVLRSWIVPQRILLYQS